MVEKSRDAAGKSLGLSLWGLLAACLLIPVINSGVSSGFESFQGWALVTVGLCSELLAIIYGIIARKTKLGKIGLIVGIVLLTLISLELLLVFLSGTPPQMMGPIPLQ